MWRENYWPGFPWDTHPDFFSVASPSMRLPQGYFQGGEYVEVQGMHPAKPVVAGHLPLKKVRVFATRQKRQDAHPVDTAHAQNPTPQAKQERTEEIFEELATKLETVWLFPELERGMALYRTSLPCADEEYSDIVRLMTAVEDADSSTDIQYWLDKQHKELERIQPALPQVAEEAQKSVDAMSANFRTLMQDSHHILDQCMGLAHQLPQSHAKIFAIQSSMLDKASARLDDGEALLRALRKEHGHVAKIDVQKLAPMRQSIADMREKLAQFRQDMGQLTSNLLEARKDQKGRATCRARVVSPR